MLSKAIGTFVRDSILPPRRKRIKLGNRESGWKTLDYSFEIQCLLMASSRMTYGLSGNLSKSNMVSTSCFESGNLVLTN
jgi:hypothetical protein